MSFIPHTNNSLFIGDLSKFCTEQNLEELFSSYGEITEVKIKRNISTGKTLSYGFVTFADDECAAIAMQELDGCLYCGRNLRIRWAVHNVKEQKVEEQIINSVYVRFITPKLHEFITEEDFHKVFDVFGCVEDVSIKESSIDKRTNRQSGYGFVHFSCNNAGIAAAFQAVSTVDNATFDGVLFNVELSKNLLKQFIEMKGTKTNQTNNVPPSQPQSRKNNHIPMNIVPSPAVNNGMAQNNNKQNLYNNNDLPSSVPTSKYRNNNMQQHHLKSLGFHNPQQQQPLYDQGQNHCYPSLAAEERSGSSYLNSHQHTSSNSSSIPLNYNAAVIAADDNGYYYRNNTPGNDFTQDMQSNYDSVSIASSSKSSLTYPPPGYQQQQQVPYSMRQKTYSNINTSRTISRPSGESFYRSPSDPPQMMSLLNSTTSSYNPNPNNRDMHTMVDSFQGFQIGNNPYNQSLINQGIPANANTTANNLKVLNSLSSSHSSDIFHKQHSDRYIAVRNDSNTTLLNSMSSKSFDDVNNNSIFNMSSKSCEDATTNSVRSDSARTEFTMSSMNNSDTYGQNFAVDFNFATRNDDNFYSHSSSSNTATTTCGASDHPLAIRAQWYLRDPTSVTNFGNDLDQVLLENDNLMKKSFSEIPNLTAQTTGVNNSTINTNTSSTGTMQSLRLPTSYNLQQVPIIYSEKCILQQSSSTSSFSKSSLSNDLMTSGHNQQYIDNTTINPTTVIAVDLVGSSYKECFDPTNNKDGKATTSVNKSKQLPLTKFFNPVLKKN